ncbi:hypothetical protein [Methylocaldum szegediense]|uniref:WGR domain-containing protein n=1 Tax=Methylocaldum szegediense TaxID=73780 RepID=A0ABN8X4K1_9GAMM|nr:hypothetical protein [Methylocaldum szegediense]CAI8817907.1 conserved protein of unknown function [Methylocaldum szegediense]
MDTYDLYRFTHADGSSKDWAVRQNANGTVTTRWGPTGPVLPQSKTRRGDKRNLVQAKLRKGYVPVGTVRIDKEGRVHAVDSTPATRSEPEQKPEDALYWRIRVGVSVPHAALADWAKAVSDAADRLAEVLGWARGERSDFEPGAIGNWRIPGTRTSGAGQIPITQSVVPLLVLMAMKRLAPEGTTMSVATEDGIEVGTDLRAEARLLAQFGTDLEGVRPLAEALGLIEPRINLSRAIQSDHDWWF